MAAAKLSPAAEKARRQKLIAIGGAVLLVVVLAVQVPRTLRMLNPGDAAPAPAETAAPAPAAAPAEPVAGTTTASAPAPAAELVDSDPPVAAGEGHLVSFDRFETKDPFRQQAEAGPPAVAATTPAAKPAPAPKPKPEDATAPPLTVVPSQPTAPVSTTPVPAGTTIEVNGAPETVETGASFPAADPVFLLAARGADGTSVKIEVAGGEYSDGRPSVVLKLGETVTLMNTASGARYALKLLTVGPS